MTKNDLYAELERLKLEPLVIKFANELIERHMFLDNLDIRAVADELLETAGFVILDDEGRL